MGWEVEDIVGLFGLGVCGWVGVLLVGGDFWGWLFRRSGGGG